ncbi:hypothetical protein ACRN9T_13015 [Shewanella baltica]|uniref:hypothetical protein n=1 Tax=Shewanella baltica TaxID=62322 RepID=UPI003D7BC682
MKDLIYSDSKAFRKLMLKISPERFSFRLLSNFPVGCCEFTSYMLAKFFTEERAISDIKMVHGENQFKKSQRHVWLNVMGYDVDITANQFSSTDKTVFCITDSIWHHSRFKIFESHQPNVKFDHFHEEYQEQLLRDYQMVLEGLEP